MPGFDGTGPQGRGPMTGRGFGPCGSGRAFRRGFGRSYGRGFGRGPRKGFGAGLGRGFGRGFGFRRAYMYDYEPVEPAFVPDLTKDQEKTILEDDMRMLENEMKMLQQDMEAARKRLKELQK
jgi:hypothetical protein